MHSQISDASVEKSTKSIFTGDRSSEMNAITQTTTSTSPMMVAQSRGW